MIKLIRVSRATCYSGGFPCNLRCYFNKITPRSANRILWVQTGFCGTYRYHGILLEPLQDSGTYSHWHNFPFPFFAKYNRESLYLSVDSYLPHYQNTGVPGTGVYIVDGPCQNVSAKSGKCYLGYGSWQCYSCVVLYDIYICIHVYAFILPSIKFDDKMGSYLPED